MYTSSSAPLVTVVVLCHNHAPYVKQALNSVLAQDHEQVQLLIVDDGSTDGSQEIITSWQKKHHKAQEVVLLPTSLGMTKAFMQVAQHITGKYLIDLAADDWLAPNRISEQVAAMEGNTLAGVCFTDAVLISENGQVLGHWWQLGKQKLLDACGTDWVVNLLAHNPICTPTLMYRTGMWQDLGGFDTSLAYEDLDILLKFALAGHGFLHLDKPLTFRRILTHSATNRQFTIGANPVLRSTASVLKRLTDTLGNKISLTQREALRHFLDHHIWLAFRAGDVVVAQDLISLYQSAGMRPSFQYALLQGFTHPALASALAPIWTTVTNLWGKTNVR